MKKTLWFTFMDSRTKEKFSVKLIFDTISRRFKHTSIIKKGTDTMVNKSIVSRQWLKDNGSFIPQSIIDYGNRFKAVMYC